MFEFEAEVGARIREEMIEESSMSSDDGSAESLGNGDVRVGAREDLLEFEGAIVCREILDLRGVGFRLNLAKERILLGSAVETAEACSRFRIVIGDEFTYEFHLDSPKSKIRAVSQSIFIQSPTLYP